MCAQRATGWTIEAARGRCLCSAAATTSGVVAFSLVRCHSAATRTASGRLRLVGQWLPCARCVSFRFPFSVAVPPLRRGARRSRAPARAVTVAHIWRTVTEPCFSLASPRSSFRCFFFPASTGTGGVQFGCKRCASRSTGFTRCRGASYARPRFSYCAGLVWPS